VHSRARHFVVPVPEGERPTRALHFVFTVLDPGSQSERDADAATDASLTELLLDAADLILSTMRWLPPKA
jgi:hypothetical protein